MLPLPQSITDFLNIFKKNKYQVYVVGGAIRELLLGHTIDNWDFATNATPDEILKLFPEGFYNNKYGTVTILTVNILFEITPFRKESDYADFRHPEKIEWARTIVEDLARRDFTINSIAFDGKKLIDPYQGQKHLKQKLIVAVGDPDKRF